MWLLIIAVLLSAIVGITSNSERMFGSLSDSGSVVQLVVYYFQKIGLLTVFVVLVGYSARKFSHAWKLRQDYNYKGSVAASFEGFRERFEESGLESSIELQEKLSSAVLKAIGAHPLRVIRDDDNDDRVLSALLGEDKGTRKEPSARKRSEKSIHAKYINDNEGDHDNDDEDDDENS